eukprot:4688094-Amphidinium_carterae.1
MQSAAWPVPVILRHVAPDLLCQALCLWETGHTKSLALCVEPIWASRQPVVGPCTSLTQPFK